MPADNCTLLFFSQILIIEVSIQQLYAEIMESDFRNQQIIDDVLNNYHQGRNCIVLTLRTAHVESLAKKLKEKVSGVITLMGGMGTSMFLCFYINQFNLEFA